MAAKDTFSENESWWDRVTRDLALDVAATIAVLYAVGLLIVNVDLGRHGVVAVDLARPEYIMVGLLWATLLTFTIAVILFVIWLFLDVRRPSSRFEGIGWIPRLWLMFVLFSMVFTLYISVLLVLVRANADDIFQVWFVRFVAGLLIPALAFIGYAWALYFLLLPMVKGQRKSAMVIVTHPLDELQSGRLLAAVEVIAGSIGVGLVGLYLYTFLVFPQLPREWGGGEKPLVELFLTEKLPVFLDRKDIHATADGRRIGPVICVLETDSALIIASVNQFHPKYENYQTIAVSRKFVTSVVYESGSSRSSVQAASPSPTSSPTGPLIPQASTSAKPNPSRSKND